MITSTANARIKAARKLHRARARRQQQRLLIEGVRLVEDAWQAGVRPEILFVEPERLAGNLRGEALVETLTASGVLALSCTPDVFAALTETVTPQGLAAIVPLPAFTPPANPTLVLVLDRVRDPGNAGTLLRSAEAAGVELVIFGPETVDLYNDKVVRAAMGGHFRLPVLQLADWDTIDAHLSAAGARYLADATGATAYDAVDWCGPAVLIVGGEAEGAGDDARRRATPLVIPMAGATESLNAAIAGSIMLFEAARQRRLARDD
jgi:TrmH family RNA methyltransferase